MLNVLFLSVFISAVVGLACTGLVLVYARQRLIDRVNERSSHVLPTPRGGGLGLTVGMLVGWSIFLLCTGDMVYWRIALAIGVTAALGWWDDHVSLSARFRFPVQLAVSGVVVWAIGVFTDVHVGPWLVAMPWWVGAIAGVVGSTWLINLTNFMDGIDGIAGSQTVIAAGAAASVLSVAGGSPAVIALALAAAGAAGAFLVWNWPPARIFMGDVGSTAVGLVFAVLVLEQLRMGISVDVALLPLIPFVLDATMTLVRRAWRREVLSQPHRSHLYQRLARLVGGHRPVTLLYSAIAALGALGSVLTQMGWLPAGVAFLVVAVLFVALVLYGRRRCSV